MYIGFVVVIRRTVTVVAVSSVLGGCTLPDLTPFAKATAELGTAVVSSGEAVVAALEENQMPELAKQYSVNFETRVVAMRAFVDYSDSLAAIAATGKNGAENANKVANAFDGLLVQIGSLAPGVGPLSNGVTNLISEGYNAVAQIRAAQSMKAAVKEADPFVQKLAQLVGSDLVDMLSIVESVAENSELSIKTCLEPHNPVGCQNIDTLGYAKKVYTDRVAEAERQLLELAERREPPNPELLGAVRDWGVLAVAVDVRLQVRNALIAETKRQKRVRTALLRKTADGFEQWAAVHLKLWKDLEDGTQPSIRNLVAATELLRGLIEKVEAL